MYTANGYFGDTRPKIYGVQFKAWADGISSGASSKPSTKGIRLYDAVGFRVIRGTTTTAEVDSFTTNNAAPFAIKECMTSFNSDGLITPVSYKTASNWSSYKNNTSYNRMIEFPLFFYSRPTPFEFRVTDTLMNGYLPSPMHYQNGVLYEKVYISKYFLNSSGMSINGQAAYNVSSGGEASLANSKLYKFDIKTYFSVMILMLIKYANLNIPSVIGKGLDHTVSNAADTYTNGQTESVQGYDGGTSALIGEAGSVVTLGLENFYGTYFNRINGYPSISTGSNTDSVVLKPYLFNAATTTKTFTLKNSNGNTVNKSESNLNDLMYDLSLPYILSGSNNGASYGIETELGPIAVANENSSCTRTYGYQFGVDTIELDSYES